MTDRIESILERNGSSIHNWTGGKADATLVVFTHGATIDHHEWDPTLPIRIILISSMPGFRDS
jgi:hypothetical protein